MTARRFRRAFCGVNMAVKISGVLKDGTGKPVQNCTIQLKAKRNSTTVVVNTLASENPDEAGRYSMDVEYGQYSVILLVEGFPPSHAGTITVYEDSQPGTLNDFLGAMTEDDARPEALRRFELMVEEVARHAEEAKKNAGEAETSARNAGISASQAEESAANADTSAGEASESARQAAESAAAAKQSEEASSSSASAAAQKPVSHHKVQQKLNCQERRQKVQPVMQPGCNDRNRKSPGVSRKRTVSGTKQDSGGRSRKPNPDRGGASRAKGNRVPRVLRGRREIKESVATPARQGQPVKGGRQVMLVRQARRGRKATGRAGRDRSDGRCRSTGSKGRYRYGRPGRPGRPTGTERRNRCGWPGGGNRTSGAEGRPGRHKSVFVWGRRALLRQTAMAGSRIQMAHSSPD